MIDHDSLRYCTNLDGATRYLKKVVDKRLSVKFNQKTQGCVIFLGGKYFMELAKNEKVEHHANRIKKLLHQVTHHLQQEEINVAKSIRDKNQRDYENERAEVAKMMTHDSFRYNKNSPFRNPNLTVGVPVSIEGAGTKGR